MLRLTIQQDPALALAVGQNPRLCVSVAESIRGGSYPDYDGVYEITPTDNAQTLATEARVLTRNIIINPIPSNYGKITWNGGFLTVS